MPSFLYPTFLFGALAAVVPIALHLFRRRPIFAVPFSALRFLDREPVDQRRRRHVRELLLLCLRAGAFLLLALAFARPYLTGGASLTSAPITIVALDTSFSMSAPGQFDRARTLAQRAVRDAVGRVGVVTFAESATLVVPPTTDRGLARGAIDRAGTSFGATRYRQALARSAEAIGTGAGRIVVVTDLQQSGWEASDSNRIPRPIAVDVVDAGAPDANLAVVDLRRDADGVVAVLRNIDVAPRSGQARLTLDDRQMVSMSFSVAAGGVADIRFPGINASRGVAAVAVDDPVGYLADDKRYLVLDPPAPPSLLAVTTSGDVSTDAFYLERALLADASRFRVASVAPATLSNWTAAHFRQHAAVVLLGTRGLDRRGREVLAAYVRGGGRLLAVAGADVDPDLLQGILDADLPMQLAAAPVSAERVTLTPSDVRHPVFQAFGPALGALASATFQRTMQLARSDRVSVLARFSTGAPALVEGEMGSGRLLLFLSDLNNRWNNLPLQPAFVPFVHEMVRYLVGRSESPDQYLVGDAAGGITTEPGIALVPVADDPGGPSGSSTRRVAVNVDPRESDPTRMTVAEFQAAVTRVNAGAAQRAGVEARDREEQQRLWRYGIALAIAMLVGEGLLARRMP